MTVLDEEDSLTDEARKDQLVQLIKRRMGDFLDLNPAALSVPLQDRAAAIADDVIAGKPAPSLPSRTSRLSLETLMALLDALKSKSKQIAIEGSDPEDSQSQAAARRFRQGQGERARQD